ncbi:hypothetical protein [Aliikangiella sp. G2MR2-5]|uniref:hypothetical protein n=1 Tax=Aliikangiella sp. G2MR2-5 TaxID=2788943 RepID=UPI0018A9A42F|nr:hypothetical protein [Aliikangiella sp. G2MR2-5]
MIREVDATPFTNRLHYSVEEVSMEEFLSVLNQKRDMEESEAKHIQSLQSRFASVNR